MVSGVGFPPATFIPLSACGFGRRTEVAGAPPKGKAILYLGATQRF